MHPENTLEAFQQAVDIGVDGLETDIRISNEGTPILFHDRCLADGRPVSTLTHRQLCSAVGYQVPSLAAALEQRWDVTWDLEVKSADALRAAIPVLRSRLPAKDLLITSFIHPLVQQAVAELKIRGGLLIAHTPLDLEWLSKKWLNIGIVVWDFETVTRELVTLAKGAGFQNIIYGPIAQSDHDEARTLGADALITDFPDYCVNKEFE